MYRDIEKKLKKTLTDEERKTFVTHFFRLQLLIDHKVKDERLRKYMADEAELFRRGLEDHLTRMLVLTQEMETILDRQWARLNEHRPPTSTPSS